MAKSKSVKLKDDGLDQIREKYIQDLRNGQQYSINKFDDQVLFISSGTLVLSLNFLKDFVKLDQALYLWTLYVSWIVLGLTIVVSVSAHLFSYDLTEKQIRRVENKEDLKEDKLTRWLNYAMAACLILGIAFQVFFVTFNTIAMADKKKNLNEIKGNTHITPKEKIIEKSLPFATAPKAIAKPKPKTDTKQYSNPVQSPPKAIAKPKNSTDSSSKNK